MRSIHTMQGPDAKKRTPEELKRHQQELMAKSLPKKKALPGVKHVVLVASGKGGVGKSTTAVNLALAMTRMGPSLNVGLLDADIYGPSIPLMMNLEGRPDVSSNKKMVPLTNYGVKCMSMGFLVEPGQAVVWRGPMVMGATEKMIFQTDWQPLDYLVIDLPPGTGDIHLSIAQSLEVSGAVVVSTPQRVALADAQKGVTMFDKVNIPMLGLVENMNAFVCGGCGEVSHVFGHDGVTSLAHELQVPLLGSVPLDPRVMRACDEGKPLVISHPESLPAKTYLDIAQKVYEQSSTE
ncbi:hypothetical protein TCAL_05680 [Tigriopus californicus]|uniref:Iron-sulfur cluster transfer protein NUBPL n=2 Tax=Tigriopus californicus TaxID=6832 RepID=A0A553PEV0_TIGCA|nr:hypothetical protein TCAL_05680 [Tigriopus californicus]|eukprot:TCALIF_05680-PA protein Name:"Similar to NUBPL Iron-sulfur protein NUBPL (Homo sapiens)" AED:0.11 eAED:0.11 QI:0/-1/0/1/-1/1/1/0/292